MTNINELVNVPTGLCNLKTKIDDLGVDKLKTVPVNLKKLSDVKSIEVLKNTKCNKLDTKVNNIENEIPDVHNFI